MPATDQPMETARGMQEGPPRTDDKTEWWANTTVLGLMAFGLTTMMAGLSNLPSPYSAGFAGGAHGGGLVANWTLLSMTVFFGGLAQLFAGLISLRKGNLFAGTAFIGYGSFWLAYFLLIDFSSGYLNLAATATCNTFGGCAPFYGIAGFAFVWLLFTFSFLINSMKHGWGLFFVFLFLFLSFILLVVSNWQIGASGPGTISTGEHWAIGGMIILTGLTAWYVATANLTNTNYGRKVLPT